MLIDLTFSFIVLNFIMMMKRFKGSLSYFYSFVVVWFFQNVLLFVLFIYSFYIVNKLLKYNLFFFYNQKEKAKGEDFQIGIFVLFLP